MFTFTPLYGAQNASPASSSLLELDGGINILIDVGWDATFSSELLQSIETHASTISLILLTHPTIDHLGAYAHACKHIPSFNRIPVYATIPVINLGLTLLTDLYASSVLAASFLPTNAISGASNGATESNLLLQPPTTEELSKCFNHITPLKYSQPHQPIATQYSPSLDGLTIAAYSAGHTVGGTIWHIQHNMESIVYAADWKQGRENLLGGAAWLASGTGGAEIIEPLRRPTALVCSTRGVEIEESLSRQKRDARLVALVRETIEQGGKVLIPTDSSARVLELAFLLNKTWSDNASGPRAATYKNAKLYMASKSASSTKRYLQSMLEWMDDAIIRDAEAAMTGKGDNTNSPLNWKFVRLIERQRQLDRALTRNMPSVILASDTSLEWGFSRQALQLLAADSKNLVILTEEVVGTSLGSQIWKALEGDNLANVITPSSLSLQTRLAETAPLDEHEQAIYNQHLARQRSVTATNSALPTDGTEGNDVTVDVDVAASESSDSEDEDENNADPTAQQQGRALNLSTQLSSVKRKVGLTDAELGVDILLTSKAHDYDVRGKRGKEKMYPFRTSRKRDDDFGESIIVGDYLRAEEREELEDAQNAVTDRKVGEKRKWDDVAIGPGGVSVKGKKNAAQNKRARTEPDDIDAAIARATGEATGINGTAKTTASDSEESEYDPDDDDEEVTPGPRKVIFKDIQFEMSARIAYVDFSARHERRDLLMLIPLIRPRKLILISGDESQTQMLAEETKKLLQSNGKASGDMKSSTEVYTPQNGEQIDASVDTNAWTLKLGPALLRRLVWQDIRGLGIVTLTGLLHAEQEKSIEEAENGDEDEIARKKRKLAASSTSAEANTEQSEKELLPVLDLPTSTSSARYDTTRALSAINRPIHVGDLRLSDLRNLLRKSGHIAEFRGEGTLLVDGIVVVRKNASGRIEVEGGVYGVGTRGITGDSVFGEVKKKVYEGLAVVGGGSVAV